MPPSRKVRSSVGEPLLLHVPQSGGGLVEQQQDRVDAQRARDLDDALLAERQAAGELIDLVAEPDALDLARRFGQQFRFVGPVEPQHAGDGAGMAAQMRADRDVFQHAHVGHQLDVLEGPGDAEFCDFLRRRVVDVLAVHRDGAAGGGEHAGDQVEGGALAGAVGADQGDDLAGLDVEGNVVDGDHAAELLSRVVDLQQRAGRCGRPVARGQGERGIGPLAERLERQPPHQPGPDPGRRQLQQQHQQDAEHDGLELAFAAEQQRQIALQDLLQDDDDAGSQHRAPDIAGAADHRDEEIFDAGMGAERGRIGGALEMRIEPAGQPGQHRRIDEHQQLCARRLHAERFGGDVAAAQRADRAAGTGVQQVHAQQRADQHRDPDRVVDRAGIEHLERADRQRRNPGDAVIAAEEFELAEQIEQADAPGDGAERQIVARQPHRDEAEQHRGTAADQQRQRQRQPWRHAIGRRQHRRGVGAEAAKRRLAERGQAADAGQQHQAHRHQGGEPDIVEQHDPERRHARDERDHRHQGREDRDR